MGDRKSQLSIVNCQVVVHESKSDVKRPAKGNVTVVLEVLAKA